jgi:ectoine hydroxylase-related dioxygenase (phytanoyl-CoA dioxygenase family)
MDMAAAGFGPQGFGVVEALLDETTCDAVAAQIDELPLTGAGSRQLLQYEWCRRLALSVRMHSEIRERIPADSVGVQCTLFTKSPSANWLVALHQDRTVPVRCKVDSLELIGWAEKEGGTFVKPPVSMLRRMAAVRVHIDPCPVESGALRVVPGSHLLGVLSPAEAERIRKIAGEHAVPVGRGGALLMKPLLLHASSKAATSSQRRVLHFVFGPRAPPCGLAWQYSI